MSNLVQFIASRIRPMFPRILMVVIAVGIAVGLYYLYQHTKKLDKEKQLKDIDQPVETRVSDLAVVCANCHMMIHVNRDKALTLAQLRKSLKR